MTELGRAARPDDAAASTAVVVLGMHRSGTSCLAGMLAAGGVASAGQTVRNWDNARGHHEMLDLVRLNEAVLAHSGGHWLARPAVVRWTAAHAAVRDRLLAMQVDGRPALLKDPRTLLVLPFWRASSIAFSEIAIVRHPLAVARSLESWREMALSDGLALWLAHNRALAEDRARHAYPLVDFERPRDEVVAAVRSAFPSADPAAYEPSLVHHDDGDAPDVPGLAEAVALYRQLCGHAEGARRAFPRTRWAAFQREPSIDTARAALAAIDDAAAVLVPIVATFLRRRAFADALAVIDRVEPAFADLLRGKVLLAMGSADAAVRHLEAACAVPRPFHQARHLLAQALRTAGRTADARAALSRAAGEAIYPHNALSTLAEWSWLDGDRAGARAEMQRAIEAAPLHRRGRLRTRLAEWLLAEGDRTRARGELERAIEEDPAYARSRQLLAAL